MTNGIFSIYDQKSEHFAAPFLSHNHKTAIRSMLDCVDDENHPFGAHPSDYSLYNLGTFNSDTGLYDLHDSPVCLGNLDQLHKPRPELKSA